LVPGEVHLPFDDVGLAKIFANLCVVRIERDRFQIVGNAFVHTAELARGIATIVQRFGRGWILQRIKHGERFAPQFVKPYVKRGKNDAADAEALCEAMSRPTMRFVPVNTPEQQAVLSRYLEPQSEPCRWAGMTKPVNYKRHRFPPQIIAHAVWLYFRFPLSLRLVEEMLLESGIVVSGTVKLVDLRVCVETCRKEAADGITMA
jgi:hypothetical protein